MVGAVDRWMFREAAFAAAVVTVVMSAPVIMISLYTNLPGDALYSRLFWPAFTSITPMILFHTLPVLVTVGIVWSYGKFSSDGTLVALHVAGRSVLSVRGAALTVAAAATVLGYVMSMMIAPQTARHLHDVLYSIRHNLSPILLKARQFNELNRQGDVLYFERWVERNKVANIFILRKADDGEERAYSAQHGVFEERDGEHYVILLNGSVQVFPSDKTQVKAVNFEDLVLPVAKAASAARVYSTFDELGTPMFLRERATALQNPVQARNWLREAMNRFGIPGFALVHTLLGLELLAIGAPLIDRRRERVALICACIGLMHFIAVLAVEQIGVSAIWTLAVFAVIGAELAIAVLFGLIRAGKIARLA